MTTFSACSYQVYLALLIFDKFELSMSVPAVFCGTVVSNFDSIDIQRVIEYLSVVNMHDL